MVRNDGVERRDDRIIPSRPFMNRDSSSSASTSSSPGIARYALWRSMNSRSGSCAAGSSSAKPERSDRTRSPPFDQTNGAILISEGSTPRPYWPRSRSVSFTAVSTNCFQVQSPLGSGRPASRKRALL